MASSNPETESNNGSSIAKEPEKPQIEAFRMPTMEEMRAQEVWNNCAVRSVASGVMGEKDQYILITFSRFVMIYFFDFGFSCCLILVHLNFVFNLYTEGIHNLWWKRLQL